MSSIDLHTEAVLDPSIQFTKPAEPAKAAYIFLTGATGFLGAYLLDELLRTTDAAIYCLIRGDDEASGMERLKRKLQFYEIWREESAERILPVIGDLAQPCLGLGDRYGELAERVDVIYHNGAQVNAMYPYSRLKPSNVLGTQEVLRLASQHKTKPVHFVSTLGVYLSDRYVGKTVTEEEPIADDGSMRGGYKQSKWVAEELVRMAHRRGLPVTIHRAGRIWGHSQTGIMTQFGDLLGTIVQACVQLGAFPSAETALNLIPVDFASRAIISLSQQSHLSGQIFHICNPQQTEWRTFWHAICENGYPLKEVPYSEWVVAIKQRGRAERDKKLWSVLRHLLRAPIYMFKPKPVFDACKTAAILTEEGLDCPTIDRSFLHPYLMRFSFCEFIPNTIVGDIN